MNKLIPMLLLPLAFSFTSHETRPCVHFGLSEMNLAYIGIDNPLYISAAGISSKELKATIDGGTLTSLGGGRYNLKVQRGNREVVIRVYQKKEGGDKQLDATKFRVRNLPKPTAQMGGIPNDGLPKPKAAILAQTTLLATMGPGFAYHLKYRVFSYEMTLISTNERKSFLASSGALTETMLQGISKLEAGDMIIFHNVRVRESKYEFETAVAPIVIPIR